MDRDVGTFRTPAGPVELSASRLGGHTQFEELETGQTFKIPHMTHASLLKRYRKPHMTDVVVEGRAPGCRHEILFAEFRKRRMADSIPRTCSAYRYKFDGTGITAIEKNAPDPKVYRFSGMHLSGPLHMSQLDPNYRHDLRAHPRHKAHRTPPVKAVAAHPDRKATHMSRPIVPGRAKQGPAPKTPSTPTLHLG